MSEEVKTITIDGVAYEIDKLSDKVKALITIYSEWGVELKTQRMVVAKSEAALRDLSREIITTIKAEDQPAAANDSAPAA